MEMIKKILNHCLPGGKPRPHSAGLTLLRLLVLTVVTGVLLVPAYLGLRTEGYKYTIDNIEQVPAIVNPLTGETVTMIELLRRDAELQDVRREVAKKMGVSLQAKPVKRGC
ncbi:MAG: hypothetical protein WC001_03850 [Desulfurivibrionaceae bacterium]